MPLKTPPQNYLSTLLALRDYYAPLVEQYEKLYTQAKDNLNHVEALLANWPARSSEQTNRSPSEQVAVAVTAAPQGKDSSNGSQKNLETETNLGQNVQTEHVSQAEEQTNVQLEIPQPDVIAVESLSLDNSNTISEVETVSVESNPTQEDLSLAPGDDTGQTPAEQEEYFDEQLPVTDIKQTDLSSVSQENNDPASVESTTVAPDLTSDNGGNNAETEDGSENTATGNLETNSSSTATQNERQQPQTTSSQQKNAQQTENEPRSLGEIPMRDEYKGLSRIEAVQKLLQKRPGSICHVDFVLRALYDELEPDVIKIVRGRVQSTLTQGKNSGLWFLVPGKPGYYTIDLESLKSNQKSSSSQLENNRKPSPQSKANAAPMKEEFEGKFLIDALASLLQQNPGKVFNPTQVMEALYGQVEPEKYQEAKTSVMNELSRGHRTGRFSRVPGEKGVYTWDVTLLNSQS
ncbi:hypothetical protein [Anabaena azotica]|uniref:Uncharacterized protein n=1 Tax=Anabaena azotica FACHB-119 TaxID=947527 RepID=A0ABR8DEG9_9NOST|nr:hypothetical protein [Anabaena azotica]MBD2504592.1 hypothetical protein [Anabaena azotica FACHB-119]